MNTEAVVITPALRERFEPAAKAVAQWWAERLMGPLRHQVEAPGEETSYSFMFAALAATNKAPSASDEQAAKFVEALTESVVADLAEQTKWNDSPYVPMGVDYHPDHLLAEAAKAAAIPTSRFPVKTMTHTMEHYVTGGLGYGAPFGILWRDEHPLPICGQRPYITEGMPERDKIVMPAIDRPWACGLDIYHEGGHGDFTSAPSCSVCGERENNYHHNRDNYGESHPFTPGPVRACTICGDKEFYIERLNRTCCRRWTGSEWVPTGKAHHLIDWPGTGPDAPVDAPVVPA